MPATYNVEISIRVLKPGHEEVTQEETNIFAGLTFGQMTNHAADFYDLIDKLKKKK